MTTAIKTTEFKALYASADAAGKAAAEAKVPTPMVVGTPTTLLGNDIDYDKPVYHVPSGVCGFSWVNVKPGNSAFANWLKKNGKARTDGYYGGVTIWVSAYGQSYEKKCAYARAFAHVLTEAGFKAHAGDRLD